MGRDSVIWAGGIVLGLVIGVALSLVYTWVLDPPPLIDTKPAALNPSDQEVYMVLIAAAYAADGDLDRTKARLAELENPDIENSIVALAERYILEGKDARDIRVLARLSDALGGTSAAMRPFIATPTSTPTLVPTATPYPPTLTPTQVVRATPTPPATPTPRRTPTPDRAETFGVAQSTALCDPSADGLLRVYVRDATGKGLAGVQVSVNWPGGEDRFYTGFKPQTDSGYADFEMESGEIYRVELVDVRGEVAQDIGANLADLCPDLPSGTQASWQVVFQGGQ